MFDGADIRGFDAASMRIVPVIRWECNHGPIPLTDLLNIRNVSRKHITQKQITDLLIYEQDT